MLLSFLLIYVQINLAILYIGKLAVQRTKITIKESFNLFNKYDNLTLPEQIKSATLAKTKK